MLTSGHLGLGGEDYALASLFGIGDTCLVAGLAQEFARRHRQPGGRVALIVRPGHRDVAAAFPGIDVVIEIAEHDIPALVNPSRAPQGQPRPGEIFVAHPSVVHVRPDHCVAHGRMSDVAMYALILGLPPQTKLALPAISHENRELARAIASDQRIVVGRTAMIVPRANSWAPIPPEFFNTLSDRLRQQGWHVWVNNPAALPLRAALAFAEIAGWVIGANCGYMQMVVQSGVRARKTILSRVSSEDRPHPLPITRMSDYTRFRKVDDQHYHVEEFMVDGPTTWPGVVSGVVSGRNAHEDVPDPAPLLFFDAQLSPGELCDRLSILEIKRERLPDQAHLVLAEITRLSPMRDQIVQMHPEVSHLIGDLARLNGQAWDLNESLFCEYAPDAVIQPDDAVAHVRRAAEAHACNRERVRVRNDIDARCHAGHVEVKSYQPHRSAPVYRRAAIESIMSHNIVDDLRRDGIVVLPQRFVALDGFVKHLMACPIYENHVRQRKPPLLNGVSAQQVLTSGSVAPWMCSDLHDCLRAPGLLEAALSVYPIVRDYLGRPPLLYSVNAFYTLPHSVPKADIQGWHRDADDEDFLALFIYCTDVRRPADGVHEYQLGTHIGPNEGAIKQVFGVPGTMFLAAPKGLHRGMIPQGRMRMVAWARWGVSDPPPSYVWDLNSPLPRDEIGDRYPDDSILQDAVKLLAR